MKKREGDLLKLYDLTQRIGISTPPWPTFKPFEMKYFKRLSTERVNGQIIKTPNHIGTHLDSERHFWTAGRDIASIPLEDLYGEGVVVDLSDELNDYDIYTSEMIENKVEVKENDILICVRNGSKKLIGKSLLIPNNIPKATHGAFMTIFRGESNKFISHWFKTATFYKEVHKNLGATINSINGSNLKKFKTIFPKKEEQEKIAFFLTSIDTKIERLTKKESLLQEYKKGVMQKIFNQEIRFKTDDGSEFCEWEEKKLGLFIEEYKEKSTVNNQHEVFTSSNKGLVLQRDYFSENRLSERDNLGFNIVPQNYITYRSRSDNRRFTFNLNILDIKGVISTYYPVFKFKNGNNKFFIEMTKVYTHFIGRYSVGTSQTVLSINDLKKIKILLPSEEEQTKIANFLSSINTKIEQTRKQLGQTKEFKKSLLQQMFV
jgi:type I restriction enzyme S subunit